MSEHDENYWQGPTIGPFIEVKRIDRVLMEVNPVCPNCLSPMLWWSRRTSDLLGVAYCCACRTEVTVRRFIEVPPVNP